MPRRGLAIVLAIALVGLGAWRGWCVLSGADIDTDAYAHHMIARAIVADPHDLGVHWVWLPLFHYAQVPLVALGGTMDVVRWINVALATWLPVRVFSYVRRTSVAGPAHVPPEVVALLAALFAAACPIAMQMGTTAQPEPLFALLVFEVAVAFEERRALRTAALLCAAVLLRYEAWASLATVAVLTAFEARRREDRKLENLLPLLAPVAAIFGWAVLRRPVDGRWFGFLAQTHEFASAATADKAVLGLTLPKSLDLAYYPVVVPARVLGPALALVPFGARRTFREQGTRFVLVQAACLAFISLSWMMRSTLGLDRHFVAVVPLYATFAAQGGATLADASARALAARPAPIGARAAGIGRGVAAFLWAGALASLFAMLTIWMGFWRASIERGLPGRAAVATFLRTLPRASTIFCDDATIEISSKLDRRRFDRHWIDDPQTWDLIAGIARSQGVTYVATWRRKLAGHEHTGALVFRTSQDPDDPTSGIAVMRVATNEIH